VTAVHPPRADHDGDALSPEDQQAVIATCTRFVWCIDERRWDDLAELFTDPFEIDYSDIFGGQAATVSPAEMVTNSRHLIGGLTATQHLIGSFLVEGGGDEAYCRSMVQASHFIENRIGDAMWTVGAQYHMRLRRDGGRWRIAANRVVMQWAQGNREVMRLGRLPRDGK
jgi:hypothetical protein